MDKYYRAEISINYAKPFTMILRGKSKKYTEDYVTSFYMRINEEKHNIFDFKIKLEKVEYVNGDYYTKKELRKKVGK